MKDDLILKNFVTTKQVGTKGLKELSAFFGGKMIDVEDMITVDTTSIQYNEVYSITGDTTSNGYQYYDFDAMGINYESIKLISLSDVKYQNHNVMLLQQTNDNMLNNTRWQFDISIKKILQTYLFLKIKERRTFKCVKSSDLVNKDINQSIYDYITLNVLDRFGLDHIDFYVKYFNILETNTLYTPVNLQYNPVFDLTIVSQENIVSNLNIITNNYLNTLNDISITYNQTKASSSHKFDYYFNIYYKKI